MENLKKLISEHQFSHITISRPRKKGGASRIRIRPVLLKGSLYYQEERQEGTQVFHANLPCEEKEAFSERVAAHMKQFRQLDMDTDDAHFTVLVNKKHQAAIRKSKKDYEETGMDGFSHNRQKNYLLKEGEPAAFLVELGVMTKEGKVVRSKYDKFRQINRFLEFIDDVQEFLPKGRELTVIDFGCGKSYLTFAMYEYLHVLKYYDVRIIGLDLKQSVIDSCNQLAQRLGYEKLQFLHGDIAEYEGVSRADMVVTLHACDTATDYALAKAVKWNAKVILSVPCCQHELNAQMESAVLAPLFRYGLIKERTAALFTDALRAQLLEQQGYKVQVMEFIDMEHTPKNILIRAVRRSDGARQDTKAYEQCRDFLGASLTLERLLG